MISSITNTAVYAMERSAGDLQTVAHWVANPERSLAAPERVQVDLTVCRATYQANATVVETADEMLKTLLDLVA